MKKKPWITPRLIFFNETSIRSGNVQGGKESFTNFINLSSRTFYPGQTYQGDKVLCTLKQGHLIIYNTGTNLPTCGVS